MSNTVRLTAEPIRSYQDSTYIIADSLGDERIAAMQQKLGSAEIPDGITPDVLDIVDHMVRKHVDGNRPDLALLGYSTIADALEEACDSKKATAALIAGRMGLTGAVKAHHNRAVMAAAALSLEDLRELGTTGTPLIYEDRPTSLHLVQLTTAEHCQFEGATLVHCLSNIVIARKYLSEGRQLYSLRDQGMTPVVTIEIKPEQAAVNQARGYKDRALRVGSREYGAVERSLEPLANYVNIRSLTVTDGKYGQTAS